MKKIVLHQIWIPLLIAALLLAASAGAAAALAPEGMLTGVVASPGGYPLPAGTVLKLFEPGSESVRGLATPNLSTGAFSLGPVPNGLYVIKAVPPEFSGYTQSLPKAVSVLNIPVHVGVLTLTEPQVVGTVYAPDGVTPASAEVFIHLGDGQVFQHIDAPTGSFAIGGLPTGGYWLQAWPAGSQPYWKSARQAINVTAGLTQTVSLQLTQADLWGYTVNNQGQPVANARVIAAQRGIDRSMDLSNQAGFWAIGGLSAGDYLIKALPEWRNSGLIPSDRITVTLPGASNPYTLTLASPPKLITGTVSTNTGLPVEHAQVVARRLGQPGHADALSGADGGYRLRLAPGLWALTVRLVTDTLPSGWVYPEPPQLVFFPANNQPESRQQDFTVVLWDATVTGLVQIPGGATPPFTVTVGLYNNEGVGRRVQTDPATGAFSIQIPNSGYKVVVHPHDPGYLGPLVDPVNVLPNAALDLGVLTLLPRDALIAGAVTDSSGAGVSNIPLAAWRPGAPGSLKTLSGPDGQYSLAVSAGDWHIQPAIPSALPYLYQGEGADATVSAGAVASDVNFALQTADAVIAGTLVDQAGQPALDASGWARARSVITPTLHNGAPVEAGAFEILVPAGTYRVAAHLPPGNYYMSTAERNVTALPGATTAITLTVQTKDARISGALWDPRNNDIVSGIHGLVTTWMGGDWSAAPINAGNGSYKLDVAAGLWRVNYRITPRSGYTRLADARYVPVASGQNVLLPLPVARKDSAISGIVRAPNGNPLPGATVIAHGQSGEIKDLWFHGRSGPNGQFRIDLPYGRYRLGAALPGSGWINPVEFQVNAPKNGVNSGNALRFHQPNAAIDGTLTVSNTAASGEVYIWAWSERGGFTDGRFPVSASGGSATGVYHLDVISGTVWHVGAVTESTSEFWFVRQAVQVASSPAVLDLTLAGPFPMPAPVAVTFDPAQPQSILLADGTGIFIPAGAIPASGNVTLRILPLAGLPNQRHANLLPYGYAFLATDENGQPIEQDFNTEVVITFAYTDAQLAALQIHEHWLRPAYYSTTTNRWELPEGYVVDMAANRITMQINHFTDYSLTASALINTYVPLVVR